MYQRLLNYYMWFKKFIKDLKNLPVLFPFKSLFVIGLFSLFTIAFLDDFLNMKLIDDFTEIVYRSVDDDGKIYIVFLHWNVKPWGVWRDLWCIDVLHTPDAVEVTTLYFESCIDASIQYYCTDEFGNLIPLVIENWELVDCLEAKLEYSQVYIIFSSIILIFVLIKLTMTAVFHCFCWFYKTRETAAGTGAPFTGATRR